MAFSSRFSSAGTPSEFSQKEKRGKEIALYFLDTGQVLELEPNREYTLGRIYKEQPVVPDIDLSPFKGYEWGISRLHAILEVKQDQVFITDNNSSNGTFHAGNKIPPDTPYLINHGDIVMLGKLRLQILISDEGEENK
jgi:pSer/pThr/pTyr-binding forkhead associated (FHA) protein